MEISQYMVDDVMTLLLHLGYIAYDSRKSEAFIPNKEIMDEYKNSVEGDERWDVLSKVPG